MEFTITLLLLSMATTIEGHGRMIEPPQRSSLWRFGFEAPVNTDDHGFDCGGMGVQYSPINHGQCGVCGDRHDSAQPRPNEAGGTYARGIIARQYKQAQTITVLLEITVAHGGWSEFRICPNNDIHKIVTQECLDKNQLKIPGSGKRFYHSRVAGFVPVNLELPPGLSCSQCVLQWRWKTDSSNHCNQETNVNCCIGCGIQEEFINCADVRIDPSTPTTIHQVNQSTGINPILPDTFLPITAQVPVPVPPPSNVTDLTDVNGFVPLDSSETRSRISTCTATPVWQRGLGTFLANRWCYYYCDAKKCPSNLCEPTCQRK